MQEWCTKRLRHVFLVVSLKKVNPFYKTQAWLKCRAVILKRDGYRCQSCKRRNPKIPVPANTVHHIKPLDEYPELALDEDNLESICPSCHNKEHPEKGFGRKKEKKQRKSLKIVVAEANQEVF